MKSVARALIVGAASVIALALACGSSPTDEATVSPAPSAVPSPEPSPQPSSTPTVAPPPPAPLGPCGLKRTDIKGSQIFCGNVRLYEDDQTSPPWRGKPNTTAGAIRNELGRAVCMSPETVLTPSRATQNFEIRGWVTRDFSSICSPDYTVEEESFIDIALDLDWIPTPADPGEPPLVRLHSMADLLTYLPATNIMKFSGRQIAGVDDAWGGGGAGQAIIHVEVDGWGPYRGGSAYQRLGPPPGWDACGKEGADQLYFHHDILPGDRTASKGDYVRVIGTQWRDDSHLSPTDLTDPKLCWAQHVAGADYWAEMHSVDKVQKLPAPPGRTPKDLIAYAACSSTPLTLTESVVLEPPPNTLPDEHIVKVIPAIWPKSAAAFIPPVFDARSVSFDIRSTGPTLAFYRVVWSSCVANCKDRCGGSDGCGGTCPVRPCGPTRVCDQDGACSCPAGSTGCPDLCQPLAEQAP